MIFTILHNGRYLSILIGIYLGEMYQALKSEKNIQCLPKRLKSTFFEILVEQSSSENFSKKLILAFGHNLATINIFVLVLHYFPIFEYYVSNWDVRLKHTIQLPMENL